MSLLETRSLSVGYGKGTQARILQKELNLRIERGQIICLMGQNGVGKTTFIKTISGLIPAINGSVYYGSELLSSISSSSLAQRLSLVLTEKPFSFSLSVLELIAIGRHPYSNWLGVLSKEDKDAIESAISATNINYLMDKRLFELSDGQLQKVMIARALAQETDLIFLDEPAAHLDLHNKIELMLLLRKIASHGKSILISTHDLQVSTQLSDQLWLFNFNEPVQVGLPEDLILDGSLEKTLYLQDFGYDMKHGLVDLQPSGIEVSVRGATEVKFWTEQALKRHGYQMADEARLQVFYDENQWEVNGQTAGSIRELVTLLKELKAH